MERWLILVRVRWMRYHDLLADLYKPLSCVCLAAKVLVPHNATALDAFSYSLHGK